MWLNQSHSALLVARNRGVGRSWPCGVPSPCRDEARKVPYKLWPVVASHRHCSTSNRYCSFSRKTGHVFGLTATGSLCAACWSTDTCRLLFLHELSTCTRLTRIARFVRVGVRVSPGIGWMVVLFRCRCSSRRRRWPRCWWWDLHRPSR